MCKHVLHLIVVKRGKTQCRMNSARPISYTTTWFGFSIHVIIAERNEMECEQLQHSRTRVSDLIL